MNTVSEYVTLSVEDSFRVLGGASAGLTQQEAAERLMKFGRNELQREKKRSVLVFFLRQFKSILVYILLLAAAVSWFTGHLTDALIILVVVLVDAIIGFIQEWKAEQAVSSLHKMLASNAKVIRDDKQYLIMATELVPGDVIILEEGDHIPADARLFESHHLRTIESSLTGESLPVSKTTGIIDKASSIGEKRNMVWKSTFVSGGYGKALVTGTGVNTEIGHIASSLIQIKSERSHFQKKIDRLGTQMGVASVIAAVVLFSVGYFTLDISVNELFLLAVAAMVSIIPEGLPSIISIVLAIGSRRISKRNAIVREFTATETLGAVTTIITDKTGTLTENALTVRKIFLVNEADIDVSGEGWTPIGSFEQAGAVLETQHHTGLKKLLTIASLCNNASIHYQTSRNGYELTGDPTEGALLVLSRKGGIGSASLHLVKVDDLPFNSTLKMRASLLRGDKISELFVIGAPEHILSSCSSICTGTEILPLDDAVRTVIRQKINSWSLDAMRVIALAYKETSESQIHESELNGLVFAGLTGMIDPPREGVKEAVFQCKTAGIRIIMATGDHKGTAVAIAKAVGIIDDKAGEVPSLSEEQLVVLNEDEFNQAIRNVNVFARLSPQSKLRIAIRLQEMGELIAMTGDGVNDAPALKKADVGIAMGVMGTDVARDSAKVVLTDDNFSNIVHAIEEGRIIFMNARQASFYLITTNFAEISTLIIVVASGLPIPLTAIQILWLNLVTDGIGDMALAAERGHGEVLKVKPLNKDEMIINKSILPFLLINVILMTALSISTYLYFLPSGLEYARSSVFIVMTFTQLFNMYNLRSLTQSVFEIGLFSNRYVTITMVSSALITIALITIPFFENIFGFHAVTVIEFINLVSLSALILLGGEIYKYLKNRLKKQLE